MECCNIGEDGGRVLARLLSFSGSGLKHLKLMVNKTGTDVLSCQNDDCTELILHSVYMMPKRSAPTHSRTQGNQMCTESVMFFALVLRRNRTLVELDLSDNGVGSVSTIVLADRESSLVPGNIFKYFNALFMYFHVKR